MRAGAGLRLDGVFLAIFGLLLALLVLEGAASGLAFSLLLGAFAFLGQFAGGDRLFLLFLGGLLLLDCVCVYVGVFIAGCGQGESGER